jgi:hypothetical protein
MNDSSGSRSGSAFGDGDVGTPIPVTAGNPLARALQTSADLHAAGEAGIVHVPGASTIDGPTVQSPVPTLVIVTRPHRQS